MLTSRLRGSIHRISSNLLVSASSFSASSASRVILPRSIIASASSRSIISHRPLPSISSRSFTTTSTNLNTMSSAAPVSASSATAGDKVSVRLPTYQKISHYDVTLIPDLTAFTFQGSVSINLELTQSTQKIVLHTADCTFPNEGETGKPAVSIVSRGSIAPIQCVGLVIDVEDQRVTFDFGIPLATGAYQLTVRYDGILNDKLAGFYRSGYKAADGSTKYMAVTQFEATDCRRAVPSVDEPAAKATFDVTLLVTPNLTAVSNMPVLSKITTKSSVEEKSENRGLTYPAGLARYKYYTSPIMSTYLLAFIVGEFDYISETSKGGTEVRVYTGLGKTDLGRFSLTTAVRALDFYNDYFGVHYPLPKMDLLAIPDFAAGAMENWGAITYRETALLVDPQNSSLAAMQRVTRTVCHEIAHMWFGNLVTMEWWSFLWLNEGFARFMEHLAADHIYPEMKLWESFVAEVFAQAQGLDALESSHPVEVTVNHPNEVNEIFDSISYAKGASLIRMLHAAIGEEAFRTGLQNYLKKFSYKNTYSSDLWAAFSESSGMDVATLMKEWTQKVGYPVVQVSESSTKKHHLCMCQERFLSVYNKEDTQKLQETVWSIPVQIASWKKSAISEPPTINKVLFNTRELEVSHLTDEVDGVFKLNPNATAFYRAQYSDKLFHSIAPSIPSLPPIERLNLLRDTFALASSGRASIVQALDILKYFEKDDNYAVVSALSGNLSLFASLHSEEAYYPAIQALIRRVYAHNLNRLGWSGPAGVKEDALSPIFRALVLSMSGVTGGDEGVTLEALKRFRAFVADPKNPANAIPADLRSTVYALAAKKGTDDDHAALLKMYRESDLQEEKNRLLAVIGLVDQKNPNAQKRIDFAVNMLLSNEVRSNTIGTLMSGIGHSKLGRAAAWSWFQREFPTIQRDYTVGQNFTINGILSGMLGGHNSMDILKETDVFFKANPIPTAARVLLQLRESISSKATRLARESAEVEKWIASQKA